MNTLNLAKYYLVIFFYYLRKSNAKEEQSTCCYDSKVEYVGTVSQSEDGYNCESWNDHSNYENPLKTFSRSCDNKNYNHNYCRAIDSTGKPKCITSRGEQSCGIPKCSETKVDKKGNDYKGTMRSGIGNNGKRGSRKTGFTCMRWDGRNKNRHIRIKTKPKGDFHHNYCRNPDNDKNGPWCYRQNFKPKFDKFNVPANSNFAYCQDIKICGKNTKKPLSLKSCVGGYRNKNFTDEWEPQCGVICKEGWDCACRSTGAPQKFSKSGEKEPCSRSQSAPFSIVRGMEAEPGFFPWTVGIRIRLGHGRVQDGGICGGSIINRKTILSAAHCFVDKNGNFKNNVQKQSKVFVGFPTELPHHNFNDGDVESNNRTYGQGVYRIEKIEIHPKYSNRRGEHLYDAAILVLKKSIQYHPSIHPNKEKGKRAHQVTGFSWSRPACFSSRLWDKDHLRNINNSGRRDTICMASGYGVDEHKQTGVLRFGLGEVLSERACMNKLTTIESSPFHGQRRKTLPKSYLCTEGVKASDGNVEQLQDSCQGDSGGPLHCKSDNYEKDKMVQTGVVSWGWDCGAKDYPSLYTRISGISKWMVDISKKYGQKAQFVNSKRRNGAPQKYED